MSTVFFMSDPHVGGHEKVASTRGFRSTREHDQAILSTIRALPLGSQLWMLGDNAGRNDHEPLALGLLDEVFRDRQIEAHLIAGNHDSCHSMHSNAYRQIDMFRQVYRSVQTFAERKLEGNRLTLSHFPYNGDTEGREKDRYTKYRQRDEGAIIVHGHVHSSKVVTRSEKGTLQIHVGFDAHHRPISIEELAQIIRDNKKVEVPA